ncbi:hypothetical protein JRQ81_019383, partial [Phrynocephalus forsythii]
MKNSHESRWMKDIKSKVYTLGLSPDLLFTTGYSKVRFLLQQHIYDIEHQNNLSVTNKLCPWYDHSVISHPKIMALYLNMLIVPKYKRAFSCARFNAMPSAILEGCFKEYLYKIAHAHVVKVLKHLPMRYCYARFIERCGKNYFSHF